MDWLRRASAWVETDERLVPVRERLGAAVGSVLYLGADHRELMELHADAAGMLASEPLYRGWERGSGAVSCAMRRLSL